MRLFSTLVFCCFCLMAPAGEAITAKLLTDREVLGAGEAFRVGIQLTMHDHWHTYWENPGFAGQAPTLKLDPVEGLEVGPLQFPWPSRWQDEEGYVTYGYDSEVVIWADARYQGKASELALSGSIDWIACRESCVPGSAKFALKLPIGASKPANAALFERYVKTTPQAYGEALPFTYTVDLTLAAEQWTGTLKFQAKPGTQFAEADPLTFFPLAVKDMADLKRADVRKDGDRLVLQLEYQAFESEVPDDLVIAGAIRLTTSAGPIYAKLPLRPGPAAAPAATPAQQGSPADPASAPPPTTQPAGPANGLAYFMLLAFLGGLILNLMPCVLPVLSLKVFSLLKDAGDNSLRRQAYGWVYTLGILASFNVLSAFFIAAKSTSQELGIGFQFQSPEFVIAISLVLFVMALSFMGVFHFGQPTSQKLHLLSSKSGYQGAFFQGALMTLLSTPCTAPMLGAAYGWALSQSTAVILVIFNTIALGLAFPYLMLCYAPRLLKFMPKPGPWMEHFKVAMGFLLLGTLVWLVYILGDLTGPTGVTGTMALLIAVGAACLIYGKSWYSDDRLKGLLAMGLILALGMYIGMFRLFDIRDPKADKREMLDNLRLKFLSEAGVDKDSLFANMITTGDKIAWLPYSPENLDHYRQQGRLVFVDFTAAWCATCKLNERTVIDTPKIRDLFSNNDVICMKADYTDKSDELTAVLRSFNRAGVPMYLVYPGKADAILLPELITRDLVTDAIDTARTELDRQASL